MEKKSFGDILTDLRVNAGFSLRAFCKEMGLDAGNWSRIEREVAKPPTEEAFYTNLQKILDFDDRAKSCLMAKARAIRIVPKELQDSELMEHMPAMLRKASGEQLGRDEAEKIVEWIRGSVEDERKGE